METETFGPQLWSRVLELENYLHRHPSIRRMLSAPRAMRRAWLAWRDKAANDVIGRVADIVKENVVVQAKEFDAVFSINPRSHLFHRLLRDGYYEPTVSRQFFSFIDPRRDIIDVGSNVGFFAVGGAKKLTTGRVLAVEPTPEAFARLSENVIRNGIEDRVILFKGLIGARAGTAEVNFVPGKEEYSSMGKLGHTAIKGEEILTETVPMDTIDQLVQKHDLRPALLKVDVEGAEFSVFAGARNTLSMMRPVVISEIWRSPVGYDAPSGADLVRLFRELGYTVHDPHDPLAEPGLRDIGEIVCIPEELSVRPPVDRLKSRHVSTLFAPRQT